MAKVKNSDSNVIANNKTASRNYHIQETLEVGIELKGSEVKSLYKSNVELKDAYVIFKNNAGWLLNCHIPPYVHGYAIENHDPDRTRKLLLHKKQILKWNQNIKITGLTVIPLRFYWKNNKIKLLIAMAKGIKQYDKREKENTKSAKRIMRQY